MVVTIIVIALILLWLTGFFGPPVIPAITPTITTALSDPWVQALLIIVIIVGVVRR